jgi:RNA-binding protein
MTSKTHPAIALDSTQRKYLRGLAHPLEPVVLVGQEGITDAVLAAVDRALTDHELIKVRMRRPEDKKEMASALATRTGATLCGLIGHTVILYRRHPQKPKIEVPR